MGRRKSRRETFDQPNITGLIAATMIVLLATFTIVSVLMKISERKTSDEQDGRSDAHSRTGASSKRRDVSGGRERRSGKLIAVHTLMGTRVNIYVPWEAFGDGRQGTPDKDSANEYSRERLPPVSQSPLLVPGSVHEIMTRKILALRHRKIINFDKFSFITDPAHVCSERFGSPQVIIAVTVASHRSDVRYYFRKHIWGGLAKTFNSAAGVRLLFFTGTPKGAKQEHALREEYNAHGDIVLASFSDNRTSVSVKAISMQMWLSSRCPTAAFAITATEDCHVNVPLMLTELRLKQASVPLFLLGKVSWLPSRQDPCARPDNPEEYNGDKAEHVDVVQGLQYLERGCVGFPMSVARLLYEAALRVPLLRQEHMFVTGVCARLINVPRYDSEAFYFAPSPISIALTNASDGIVKTVN